jgi:single-stranded-DNA-specific exonuclease
MVWEYKETENYIVENIARTCGLSLNVAKILIKRGLDSGDKIRDFINPDISKMRDPFRFEQMEEVVSIILEKRDAKEKIVIYGDYDVDGITSAAFMTLILRNIGVDTEYYIPNRLQEGYGLNKKAIDIIKRKNGKLIITVDVGINSKDEIKYAKEQGVVIIVTDHHKMLSEPEEDLIMINPKVTKKYEFTSLAGAGVALKLAEAIYLKLGISLSEVYKYLDIVMLGTVADVVPMVDENRIIIKKGLEKLKNSEIKGISYLLKYLKINKSSIDTTDVSFFIAPMLNALGRTGDSTIGVDFFIENDEFVIYNIIEEMKKANKKRRNLERLIFNEIIEKIQGKVENMEYIFLKSDRWHPGVIGVVSARLALKYNIPVLLVSLTGKMGKASCRSVEGINIFNILKSMSDRFVRFGGHDLAAGFVAREEELQFIEENIVKMLPEKINNSCETDIKVDLKIEPEAITNEFMEDIMILAPFGIKNNQPLFYAEKVYFTSIKRFGVDNRHFKMYICKNKKYYPAVGFNLSCKLDRVDSQAELFDIIYYPERVEVRGEEMIQFKIKDFKKVEEFENIFNNYNEEEENGI